jgi:hypothetical protein
MKNLEIFAWCLGIAKRNPGSRPSTWKTRKNPGSRPSTFYDCEFHLRLRWRGLLDRSMALYFYKQLKTSLHKPRGNLLENLFSKKCEFKNNLLLLEKKFLSQTNKTPKNGVLLSKMAHFQESSLFQ